MAPRTAPRRAERPQKNWEPLDPAELRGSLALALHYSSKSTNSNAAIAGVRLPAGSPEDLPYVAFSTSSLERRRVTYAVGGAPRARPVNRAMDVLDGEHERIYGTVPTDQTKSIEEALGVLDSGLVIDGVIDRRMRQLLMPAEVREDGSVNESGGDVAVVPLGSAPFSKEIAQRNKQKIKEIVQLAIGGGKPQNVGRYTFELGSIMVFRGPENPLRAQTLAVLGGALDLADLVPAEAIVEFASRYRDANDWQRARMPWRDYEDQVARDIARRALAIAQAKFAAVLHQGGFTVDDLADELERDAASEPVDDRFGESVSDRKKKPADAKRTPLDIASDMDPFQLGLLDPRWRDARWIDDFASRLIVHVQSFKMPDGSLLADAKAFSRWRGTIASELRHLSRGRIA